MGYRFTVVLTPETDPDFNGYYNAAVPALPGCFSYGSTREEALHNIKEAIVLYVEDLKANGEPIPTEETEQVEVTF